MKPPAFQFYADDFLAGTADMSNEEVGAYIRLLCHQWAKGSIPSDPERISRMAMGMAPPSLGYVIAKFSPCEDGTLKNSRMEQVRQEQSQFREKQARNGKKGAESRWIHGTANGTANGTAIATPMAKRWPDDGSPSPSPKEEEGSTPASPPTPPAVESKKPRKPRAPKPPEMSDGEWLESLKAKPDNAGKDVGSEYAKMLAWCERKRETPTRRRFEAWLKRIEQPLALPAASPPKKPFVPEPHRGIFTQKDLDDLNASYG